MLSFGKKSTAINTDRIDTLIGKNTEVIGDLKAEGTVRVDGKIKGHITLSGNLIMGEHGSIEGNVNADNIHLSGVIKGDVTSAEQLHIAASGKLFGDMTVKNIIIDEGGTFQGNCIMMEAEAAISKEDLGKKEDKNK